MKNLFQQGENVCCWCKGKNSFLTTQKSPLFRVHANHTIRPLTTKQIFICHNKQQKVPISSTLFVYILSFAPLDKRLRSFMLQSSFLSVSLLLHTIYHTPYAKHDEGDAEELAHIERHAYLEVGLYLLEELHEEAEGEDGGKAVAKEEACAYFTGHTLVDIPADESEQGIGDSFIELSRMARKHVNLCEDESEVTTCRTPNNLGIHQITHCTAAAK